MSNKPSQWFLWPLLIVLLPFIVVVMVLWCIVMVLWCVAAISLLLVVWTTWCARGRYALVVYSNSPIWQQYFEERVLPDTGDRAVALNWSDRKRWRFSLPVVLFRMFAGSDEFNPIAIVFEPWRWPRRFRFFRAFQAFKHGRPEGVEALRAELLRLLDQLRPASQPLRS